MDIETTILAYKTGLITIGEAMAILVHKSFLTLRQSFRELTGENPDVMCIEFHLACGARRRWIEKQSSSPMTQVF